MSGQAKRSRVLAMQRWREQAASLVVDSGAVLPWDGHPNWGSGSREMTIGFVLSDSPAAPFDVAIAREYGERLVALGRHHRCPDAIAMLSDWREEKCGTRATVLHNWPWRNLHGHDVAYVRLGRRLLAALEGQSSECRACGGRAVLRRTAAREAEPRSRAWLVADGWDCEGGNWETGERNYTKQCPDCRGTGHNLAGRLPPIDYSPAQRRKASDTIDARMRSEALHPAPGFTVSAYEAGRESGGTIWRLVDRPDGSRKRVGTSATRTSPRGVLVSEDAPPDQHRGEQAYWSVWGDVRMPRYDSHVFAREFLRQVPAWRRSLFMADHCRDSRWSCDGGVDG